MKGWSGYFPNPFKVLAFVFSPVAMTVVLGELVVRASSTPTTG